MCVMALCWVRPEVRWEEKVMFSIFFFGAITCMALSFAFHTMSCHSQHVTAFFCK